MDKVNVYPNSKRKVFLVILVIFIFFCLVFSFTKGEFDPYGFEIGFVISTAFSLVIVFNELGRHITITKDGVVYYPNMLNKLLREPASKILISQIKSIRLGLPRVNKQMSTFAAINISSDDKEISFNPDLYDNSVIQKLFKELKARNPKIKLDKYSRFVKSEDPFFTES